MAPSGLYARLCHAFLVFINTDVTYLEHNLLAHVNLWAKLVLGSIAIYIRKIWLTVNDDL